MLIGNSGLGFDYGALWSSVKQAGADLITKELPAAAQTAVEKQVSKVATPIVQQQAQKTAATAYSKGSVAAFAAGGALLGAVIAGGTWKRRAVGGVVLGAAGAFVGFKFGLQLASAYS